MTNLDWKNFQNSIIDAKKNLESEMGGELFFVNNFSSKEFWFNESNKNSKICKNHSDILGERVYFCFKVSYTFYKVDLEYHQLWKCSLEIRNIENYIYKPIYRNNISCDKSTLIYKNIHYLLSYFLKSKNIEFKVPFQIGCNNIIKFY